MFVMKQSEYKSKIVEYLKRNLKKGYPLDSLRWALVNQGYSKTLIDMSIKEANVELAREAPALREKPVITHEIIEEPEMTMMPKKPLWKRIFGMD
jgi:hypothetical protein